MTAQSGSGQGEQAGPLQSDKGATKIGDAVASQIAGIAAQEVEKVQMGGGASAAVGGFLSSVTGAVGGSSGGSNFSKGVSVEVGTQEAAIDLTMAVEDGQAVPQLTEAARRDVINKAASP